MPTTNTAIVVTGARCVNDNWFVDTQIDWTDVLDECLMPEWNVARHGRFVLIHGDCECHHATSTAGSESIDRRAGEWAKEMFAIERTSGIYRPDTVIPCPANWSDQGDKAGPIRNSAMLKMLDGYRDMGWRTQVIAIHPNLDQSRGTIGTMRRAQSMRFDVWLHNGLELVKWDPTP